MNTETKPGYRTTEFWLSMAAMVIGAIYASGALVEGSVVAQVISVAATILTALGYTVARTMVKKGNGKG